MKKSSILQSNAIYNEASHSMDVGIGLEAFDYLHYHDLYEINLILSGEEDLYFSNSHIVLKEHELCIFRPYEIHRRLIKNPAQTSQLSIAIRRDCMEHAVSFLGSGIDPAPLFNTTSPFIRRIHSADMKIIYEHIKDLYDPSEPSGKNDSLSDGELKIVVINLLVMCLKTNEKESFTIPVWLQQLTSLMDTPENCQEGVGALTRLSGKSASTISHAFRQYYNMTPTEFISEKRTQLAAKMLLTSDDDIASIAYASGFGSLSYFYKEFNKAYGQSPLQFRKKQRDASALPSGNG